MQRWSTDELRRIGDSDEREIASVRSDGTLRRPVTIWIVRVGDDVYVRSVTGRSASWFRGAQDRHEARVSMGGVTKDV
jgi:hypothetical protein